MTYFFTQWKKRKAAMFTDMKIAGVKLENKMHQTVAQDTGALDRSITTDQPFEIAPGIVVIDVGSEGISYAQKVEEGEGREYKYHRWRGGTPGGSRTVVYVGDGMKWAKRSLESVRKDIYKIIGYGG